MKLSTKRGIRIREVTVKITDKNLQYYKPIIDIFEKNPQAYDLKIKTESAKAFSGYITKISKKLWPRKKYHASAYSFRHAKATELKNSEGFDAEKIAKIMGHASVRSQQSYGRKNKRSAGGFDDITDVETSSKPRGGDRLLRFKIASKQQTAAKIAAISTPPDVASPPPVRRLKR
ncbi:TPA: site-specific integrase [Klebsiella pneumoniae]|nr:site-specific integrase [Klebsiella pneumoniae]